MLFNKATTWLWCALMQLTVVPLVVSSQAPILTGHRAQLMSHEHNTDSVHSHRLDSSMQVPISPPIPHRQDLSNILHPLFALASCECHHQPFPFISDRVHHPGIFCLFGKAHRLHARMRLTYSEPFGHLCSAPIGLCSVPLTAELLIPRTPGRKPSTSHTGCVLPEGMAGSGRRAWTACSRQRRQVSRSRKVGASLCLKRDTSS